MRVKLFWKNEPTKRTSALDLETEINSWLSENPNIKVVDVQQSASGGSLAGSLWFMSVWYEEKS
jgi:hypothetical protein